MENSFQNLQQAGSTPINFRNSLQNSRTIALTFTADNAQGTAATNDIFVIPGVGSAAAKSLPSGVTLSGDYSSMADLCDVFENVKFAVESIDIETSSTANYEGTKFVMGMRRLNKKNPAEVDLRMSQFQTSNGSGLTKTATIDNRALSGGFLVEPLWYLKFVSLLKNTSVTIYLKVSHQENGGVSLLPADF